MSASPVLAAPPAVSATYRSSHFAPAFFFLPPARRRALSCLYSVCRVMDDAVDQPHPDPRGYLERWRQVFETRRADALADHVHGELARNFLRVREEFGVPAQPLIDMIDKGFLVDLQNGRFATPLDLESYCYGVAGTVGVACLPIFGVPVEAARSYAIRLGIAVQWVNVIRDVAADAAVGRVYLPLDHREQFGYTESELFASSFNERFKDLMRWEAQTARGHFRRATELLPAAWAEKLLPARIMGRIYLALLERIEKSDFDVFRGRVRLNFWQKARATWQEVRNRRV